jgi:hypothetical protein
MFRRVAGLPVLPRLDLAAQRRRMMPRCQRFLTPDEPQPRRQPRGQEDEPQAHDR